MTAGPDSGVWNRPQGDVIFYISAFTEFTVLQNSDCEPARRGNLRWAKIQLDDGRTGWTAYGYSDGITWIEPVPGGGSNGASQPPQNTLSLTYSHSPFGATYTFTIDRSDANNCAVINGAQIVSQELNRSYQWLSGVFATENIVSAGWTTYNYLKNGGGADTFRARVEERLLREADCRDFHYQLGNGYTMDSHGLGNVLFGYYSLTVSKWVAHRIGDLDQLWEDGRLDFADDRSQISWGIEIAESGSNLSSSDVVSHIPSNFISSR